MEQLVTTNSIVMCKENYNTVEEFRSAFGEVILQLLQNKEECLVRCDELAYGIYCIEHTHDPHSDDDDWGDVRFMAITSDEEEMILNSRLDQGCN